MIKLNNDQQSEVQEVGGEQAGEAGAVQEAKAEDKENVDANQIQENVQSERKPQSPQRRRARHSRDQEDEQDFDDEEMEAEEEPVLNQTGSRTKKRRMRRNKR